MWTQCEREHPKALFSDSRTPKIIKKSLFDKVFTLRVQEAAGSNPVTPTIKKQGKRGLPCFFMVGAIASAPAA
jgi:hypothetical protein